MNLRSDLDSASKEDEPSPLEYARGKGLCNTTFDKDFGDPSDSSITDTAFALTRERLAVNRETALLLQAVYTLREPFSIDCLQSDGRSWTLGLKLELPVLQSDDDLDLLSFGSATSPNLKNLGLPSETVVEQNDGGFEWPTKYLTYPAQCSAQLKAEKLTVSKNVLLYLQDAVRDEYVPEDSEALRAEFTINNSGLTIRPITPPLLPLSPLHVSHVPSSPTNNLPLASDSNDSICAEALELQNQIMLADSIARKESDSGDSMLLDTIHPPPFSPLSAACTMLHLERKVENLKVEGPLTPPMFSSSPMKRLKLVSFASTVNEYISYEPWGQDKTSGGDDMISSESLEFLKEIKPLAEKAENLIKNEQLSGADTTARVDVPDVDFTLPVAPWFEYSQRIRSKNKPSETELEAQKQFLRRIKREEFKSAASWHGMSIPEREMQWSFLTTKLSTLKLQETLHGESEMDKILHEARSSDIATSSAQIWKRDGLRILDEDEEDELESVLDEDSQDIEALVRKRKLEMDEEATEKQKKRKVTHHPPSASLRMKTLDAHPQISEESSPCMQAKEEQCSELTFSGFSAKSALHRFLETRGKTVRSTGLVVMEKHVLSNHAQPADSLHISNAMRPAEYLKKELHKASFRGEDKSTTMRPLPPLPDIPVDLKPCSFIISSKFLQQRSLLKQIEQIFPRAEMVYRDYALPHSPAQEADIVISPSTGLVIFSLQQVKQRALPGQPEKSLIKECIKSLQSRYERLVVMISDQLNRESEELGSGRPDDPRDREALKAIEVFAAQMQGQVLVKYILGGEKALARSVVIEMGQYGLPYGSADIGDIKPIVQETTHEVFLRRAGLNPFAAQAIVALLKKPVAFEAPQCPSSPFSTEPKSVIVKGLCRFLTMSAEERTHSFQALMGGNRVLQGVSGRLDQEWISAAHGFRII